MATVTLKNLLQQFGFSGTPYGNAYKDVFSFATNSSGAYVGSDQTTAVLTTDKVRFGVIPAGTLITGALAIVSDAFTATSTAQIGFEYVDGVDSTSVPQDADYFFAALAWSSVGRTAMAQTDVRPVVLPKDAYVIVSVGTAALDAVGILDFVVEGVVVGQNGNGSS